MVINSKHVNFDMRKITENHEKSGWAKNQKKKRANFRRETKEKEWTKSVDARLHMKLFRVETNQRTNRSSRNKTFSAKVKVKTQDIFRHAWVVSSDNRDSKEKNAFLILLRPRKMDEMR